MAKFVKKIIDEAKEHPIATLALGTSATNAAINAKRSTVDKKYQKKQLDTISELTESIKDTMPEKKRTIVFIRKQKNNSHTVDYAIEGAKLGAGIGIIGAGLLPKKLGTIEKPGFVSKPMTDDKGFVRKDRDGNIEYGDKYDEHAIFDKPGWNSGLKKKIANAYNNSSDSVAMRKALAGLTSMAIGATLGFIVGVVHDVVDLVDKKNVDKRLLKNVISDLKKIGFKEDQDFTTNPRTATLLKTKVCLGISKTADTLRLLVNTVNDSKLTKLSQETTKNLPSMSTRLERVSDRFNDINITTASGQGNSTFVASIAEKFIRAGYPVQLVEVG